MIDARFRPMEKRVNTTGETRKAGFKVQWARVLDELERELNHIDAADTIIEGGFASSQIRNDGWPRGGCAPSHQDIRLFCTAKVGPFGEHRSLTWWEPAYTPDGKVRGVQHWRLFYSPDWSTPIHPHGEPHTLNMPAGWKGWTEYQAAQPTPNFNADVTNELAARRAP